MAVSAEVSAQRKYISPVDFPILLAGNVGELRTDAFHAGIDIKGMKGLGSPVFAVADGYVWRVGVSPWGYGNVIYIKHKDGAVSVYGHLHEFSPKIAAWVRERQYAKKSFTIDLFPTAEQFPVKQGDRIAGVGNSGSSGGAHVHLEIRDPHTGMPMNLIKEGFYTVADHEKPVLKSVKLFEIDTVGGLEIHRLKASIVPPGSMNFKLSGRGYLAYEVVDYKDGKSNTMGLYSIEQKVDGKTNYSFAMDRIDFGKGRYMNAHTEYGEHRASKFDVIRAYLAPNNLLAIYRGVVDRGVIQVTDTPLEIETTITDDAGNATIVKIKVEKDSAKEKFTIPQNAKAAPWNKNFSFSGTNFWVSIPSGSLYEDCYLEFGENGGIFTIGSAEVPLHKAATVTILVPQNIIAAKAGLVSVAANGKISWAGGSVSDGKITASLNRLGNYKAAHDTVPPVITVLGLADKGSNLLRFRISDNLSGIASYVLTIDGAWALAEYDGKTGTLIHKVKRAQTPVNHNIALVITDAKNNRMTFKRVIKW